MNKLLVLYLLLCSAAVAAIDVPVNELEPWTVLSFNGIAPNVVAVVDDALEIKVRSSASPLVYPLDEPARVNGVTVIASWSGELNIPEDANEGGKGADDFVLKFGIVESGDRRLNWFQRRIAADWIKELFRLAPEDSGISRINFLSTTQRRDQVGVSRTHPLSDLLHEKRVLYLQQAGPFVMEHVFDEPVETLALWLSVDGDDTGSDFELRIERITLHTGE